MLKLTLLAAYTEHAGDFPDPERYARLLTNFELDKLPKVDAKSLRSIEKTLTQRIPELVGQFGNPYEA